MKKRAIKKRNELNKEGEEGSNVRIKRESKDQEKESIDNRGSRMRRKRQKNKICIYRERG